MTIRLPRLITPDPDRDLDCQAALEETFKHVLALAERSGWTRTETAEALREPSFAHLSTEEANVQTELAIIEARMTKH